MKLSRVLLLYLPLLVILVGSALYFAYNPGGVTLQWLGYRLDMHVGAAVFLIVVVYLVLQFLWWLLGVILRSPRSFSTARSNARKAKGYRALTRGLTAVAAGDAGEARRQAKIAHDLLGEPPLTLLLAAQAAQLAGDENSAERYFAHLTQSPETALLGLRGLATGALKRGDEHAALSHAEKAMAVAPQAAWAAETAHRLQVKAGKLDLAKDSLNNLTRAGGLSPKEAQRRRAALLTEQARRILSEPSDAQATAKALALAREGLKLAGDFVPARLALGRALLRQGKAREAAKLVEQVWDDHPHVALGRLYLEAVGGDSPLDRAQRVQRLVKQNPDHAESHRIAADAALTAKLWGEARRHLERLLELERAESGPSELGGGEPTADTCRRMARLEAGEHGAGSSGERQWLDMAARARGNADWVCNACGTPGAGGPETAGWQLTCPHCDAIDSLVWRAGSVSARGDGGLLLEAAEPAPAAAFLTASTLPPAPPLAAHAATSVAPPPSPIPHGPIPHGSPIVQPVPSATAVRETAEPAPIGASVDAARRVN
ncbi:MAG TPA: heme biosynthesis HemY N-terminal domain-containing protein [Dongiaceae bacterium]|nr:heme biosynthesis HemY N-terminal domain-containing protein [Dongiaceae bacterium]